MNDLKILAFVGMPGSGKGTCTTYLSETYGWPVVHFGNMLYEEVQRRGLDNVKDEKFVREDMRRIEGAEVLAKHAGRKAKQLAQEGHHIIVFDGLYSWSEYKHLADEFGDNLIVIAVAAARRERYRRILERSDSHRKYASADQIKARDIDEIEHIEKGGPIAFADYTVLNDQDPLQLIDKLVLLLKEIALID